jgi:hypothetical protein
MCRESTVWLNLPSTLSLSLSPTHTHSHPSVPPHPAHHQDFPYNFEPGVLHHNVWATRPLSAPELDAAVRQHRPPDAWDALCFVNPAALASIPAIWHAHVLSRARQG